MRLASLLNSPEYVYRPWQIAKRLLFRETGFAKVRLANGLSLTVNTRDAMGRSMATRGIYDLEVTECLTRLLEPGELAVDAGANIGYMSAIMASRVGSSGRVVSFEPNSALNELLRSNVRQYEGRVEIIPCALSSEVGQRSLYIPKASAANCGIASLEASAPDSDVCEVKTMRLDDVFASERIALLKLDIEGHEFEALKGAANLLRSGRIRDIVFEEHKSPSDTISLLKSCGYALFYLGSRLSRPLLESVEVNGKPNAAPNFLATIEPDRASHLYASAGWRCLKR